MIKFRICDKESRGLDMEIKEGEWIRTIDGYIRKIDNINTDKQKITYYGKYILDMPYKSSRAVAEKKIKAHSKDIIDLIEEKDILCIKDNVYNEIYISVVCKDYKEELCVVVYECDEIRRLEEYVKNNKIELISILTHEQFDRECYKIGD